MVDWMLIPLQYFACLVAHFLASIFWRLDQILLMGAVMIHYFRAWLQTDILDFTINLIFQPGNGNFLMPYIAGALGLAVLLGGIFLILRNLFIHSSPVDFRRIIFWTVLIGYILTNRNTLFRELESFRADLASGAYNTAAQINDGINYTNRTEGEIPHNPDPDVIPQVFPALTHPFGPQERTALDATAYHLEASQDDIAQITLIGVPLPTRFYQDYYTTGGTQYFPVPSDNSTRTEAVNHAMTGAGLMLTGIVPSIVAIIQALISLLFALSATILFFSLPVALPFTFFTATEVIALEILRAYVNLIVKTFVVNLLLAIFMGFLIYWGSSGNIAAFLAMSALTLYLCVQLMRIATQTFQHSVNAITSGVGMATGTRMMDPIATLNQQVKKLTGAALTAAAVAATGGSGALAGAGALLSSSGYPAAGSAMVYGSMRRRGEPGDYARRSLERRHEEATAHEDARDEEAGEVRPARPVSTAPPPTADREPPAPPPRIPPRRAGAASPPPTPLVPVAGMTIGDVAAAFPTPPASSPDGADGAMAESLAATFPVSPTTPRNGRHDSTIEELAAALPTPRATPSPAAERVTIGGLASTLPRSRPTPPPEPGIAISDLAAAMPPQPDTRPATSPRIRIEDVAAALPTPAAAPIPDSGITIRRLLATLPAPPASAPPAPAAPDEDDTPFDPLATTPGGVDIPPDARRPVAEAQPPPAADGPATNRAASPGGAGRPPQLPAAPRTAGSGRRRGATGNPAPVDTLVPPPPPSPMIEPAIRTLPPPESDAPTALLGSPEPVEVPAPPAAPIPPPRGITAAPAQPTDYVPADAPEDRLPPPPGTGDPSASPASPPQTREKKGGSRSGRGKKSNNSFYWAWRHSQGKK